MIKNCVDIINYNTYKKTKKNVDDNNDIDNNERKKYMMIMTTFIMIMYNNDVKLILMLIKQKNNANNTKNKFNIDKESNSDSHYTRGTIITVSLQCLSQSHTTKATVPQ